MKKAPILIAIGVCLTLFLTNCKKQSSDFSFSSSNPTVSKVKNWLDSLKGIVFNDSSKVKIQSEKDNLDFNKLRMEPLNQTEQLVIIPLKTNSVVPVRSNALYGMLFILNASGQIRKGNVIQYISSKGAIRDIPDGTFSGFYSHASLQDDPRITFYSITGHFLYEFNFANGHVSSFSTISRGAAIGRSGVHVTDDGCTDWYLVSTYVFDDGSSETDYTYLFTTCGDTTGGSGDGGGCGDEGVGVGGTTSTGVDKLVSWRPYSASCCHVTSTEHLYGVKTTNCDGSTGGYFTDVTHVSSVLYNDVTPNFASWQETAWSKTISSGAPVIALATISGKVTASGTPDVEIDLRQSPWYFPQEFP